MKPITNDLTFDEKRYWANLERRLRNLDGPDDFNADVDFAEAKLLLRVLDLRVAEIDALRLRVEAAEKDTRLVDGLAYDIQGGPIFDGLGDHDVHEAAATGWDGEGNERSHYLRAFRYVVEQALDAATHTEAAP